MERELQPYAPLLDDGSSADENISMVVQELPQDIKIEIEPISNLDAFLQSLYHYWCEKGLWVMMVGEVFRLLALAFIITFSAILLLHIKWSALSDPCVMQNTCDILEAVFVSNPWHSGNVLYNTFCAICLLMFSVFWLWKFVRFFGDIASMWRIREFCLNRLGISERLLPTLSWPELVYRLVRVQSNVRLCVIDDLTELDVVCRIMRRENYLIAMLNNGIIPLSFNFPFFGQRVLLTKTMEWNLYYGLLDVMFDGDFRIRKSFMEKGGEALKRRFRIMAFLNLLICPFVILFVSIYFFMRNAEKFYHRPAMFGARRWTQLAKWKMREINEVPHYVSLRLEAAKKDAEQYLNIFPTPVLIHASKLISFVAGSFMALLIAITFADEKLLEHPIAGRNIMWWLALLGLVIATTRVFLREEDAPIDNPEVALLKIVRRTHYLPKHWRGRADTREVKTAFEQLFQNRLIIFLEEMVSITLMPYMLAFRFTRVADEITSFLRRNTDYREGLGDVCSLSLFDLSKHGNSNYGSPFSGSKDTRSKQGKIEKSLLSFVATYPTWKMNKSVKEFLKKVVDKNKQQKQQQLSASLESYVVVDDRQAHFMNSDNSQTLHLEIVDNSNRNQHEEMSQYHSQQHTYTDELDDSIVVVGNLERSAFYDYRRRIEYNQILLQQFYEDSNEGVWQVVGRGRLLRNMNLSQQQSQLEEEDEGQEMRSFHPLMP